VQISKWGNSLAVRIPAEIVRSLDLKEGDQVDVRAAAPGILEIARDDRRRLALETLRSFRGSLPAGWRFDREEANARGPDMACP